MQIEPFKMKVTPEESKIVQEVLFKNGYTWRTYKTSILDKASPHLFFKKNYYLQSKKLVLSWGDSIHTFAECSCPELTFQQFKEKYMKEEFVLPEKWCVCATKETAKYAGAAWFEISPDNVRFFNFIGKEFHYWSRDIDKRYTEISLTQFEKYVLNKQSKEMELKITKEKVLSAAKKCSQAKEVLKEMFPEVFEDDKYLELKNSSFTSAGYKEPGYGDIIRVRQFGEFIGKAFWLNENLNWEIKIDKEGEKCLIPTKKQ